jgi:hypothetical protein
MLEAMQRRAKIPTNSKAYSDAATELFDISDPPPQEYSNARSRDAAGRGIRECARVALLHPKCDVVRTSFVIAFNDRRLHECYVWSTKATRHDADAHEETQSVPFHDNIDVSPTGSPPLGHTGISHGGRDRVGRGGGVGSVHDLRSRRLRLRSSRSLCRDGCIRDAAWWHQHRHDPSRE